MEYEQLKQRQMAAFKRQNLARSDLSDAEFNRSVAINDARVAYKAMRCASQEYKEHDERYQNTRLANGPQIDLLEEQCRAARTNALHAADVSRYAYSVGDHTRAREMSQQKTERYTEEAAYNQERLALMAAITSARIAYERSGDVSRRARETFVSARAAYDPAHTRYERVLDEHQLAQAALDEATEAVNAYIKQMCSGNDPALIRQASIPDRYVNECWTHRVSDGTTHFYFGGIGLPDGPEHGHRKMTATGAITYDRGPSMPRGAHNHIDIAIEATA